MLCLGAHRRHADDTIVDQADELSALEEQVRQRDAVISALRTDLDSSAYLLGDATMMLEETRQQLAMTERERDNLDLDVAVSGAELVDARRLLASSQTNEQEITDRLSVTIEGLRRKDIQIEELFHTRSES